MGRAYQQRHGNSTRKSPERKRMAAYPPAADRDAIDRRAAKLCKDQNTYAA